MLQLCQRSSLRSRMSGSRLLEVLEPRVLERDSEHKLPSVLLKLHPESGRRLILFRATPDRGQGRCARENMLDIIFKEIN